MKKQNDQIEWTDVLFIPAGLALSYILSQWLRGPLAITLSVVLVSLVFLLFGRRERSVKRVILAILLGATVTYTLTAFFSWPP